MLVLTRKVGEAVVIGGGVVVRVLETGGRVRLGVEAPDDVLVLREEIAARLELPTGSTEPKRTLARV